MGKPRLTRGLGARVLCTAPRRRFPIVLFARDRGDMGAEEKTRFTSSAPARRR